MPDVEIADLVAEQKTTNTILRAAFKSQLEAIVKEIMDNKASTSAVALLAEGPKPAGELTNGIERTTALKGTAIGERLAALVEYGVIVREGGGPSTSYRIGSLLTAGQMARIRAADKSRGSNAGETD